MPTEVIDLLSSPEPPKVTTSKHNSGENLRAITKTALPKKAATYKPPKKGKDDWFTLFSDSDVDTIGKPSKPAFNAPRKPTEKPEPAISLANKPRQPLHASKYSNGVYFNSDDFDSTVNFDDSFTFDLPPAKKRRLSSSPEILLPQIKTSRASGFQRSVSNVETTSYKAETYKSSTTSLKGLKTISTILESDPIVFTSSPDPFEDAARRRRERQRKEKMEIGDKEDIFGLEPLVKERSGKKGNGYDISGLSSDDLPDLDDIIGKDAPNTSFGKSMDESFGKSTLKKSSGKSSQSVANRYYAERVKEKKAKEAAQKTAEKADERQIKKATKDAEKERKRLEREEKANEKERLAEIVRVNIVKTSKQRSSHEMIVDLPSSISDLALGAQVVKLLDKAEVKHSNWESTLPVVKWRRKVSCKYNEEAGQWEPTPTRIDLEGHIIFIMTAKEFVELATTEEGKDIDSHILNLRAKFPASKIIYLIEGLMPWIRKNRTIKNRKFTETVRNQGQAEPVASQRSKKKKEEGYVDEDLIEDALLRLQVMHGALIHHSTTMVETAEWVLVFTQHISIIPYRLREQSLSTSFCMESGQIRGGDDAADSFIKMLQEMTQITASVAYSIAAEYPTVRQLVGILERDGPLAVQDCRKTANKNGAFTDRRVGPSISKRLHQVFTGRDQWSMNV